MADSTTWPIVAGTVRPVLWRVLLEKKVLVGCESVEVHATNHRKASTIHMRFGWGADPDAVALWLDKDPPLAVELQVAVAGSLADPQWRSHFVGEVSDVDFDAASGVLEVHGRDLAGRLIEAKTRESFRNKTGSEIVQLVAAKFGLTAEVDATSTKAGAYYQLEHDKITHDDLSKTTTYWDLLSFLAAHDDRDLWVEGTTLHYKATTALDTAPAVTLPWVQRDATTPYARAALVEMKLRRSLTISKGIKIIVKIWSAKAKGSHTVQYPPGAKADAQEYVYVKPGMSPQQALVFAQAAYKDAVAHERIAEVTMPGALEVNPRSVVAITGLPGKTFNTRFAVDELTSVFGSTSGFRQTMMLKNHKTQSQASVG